MTIAKRLALLLALPIVVLIALGGLVLYQLSGIQKKSRFVSEIQIESLAALGNISRELTETRVNLRDCVIAEQAADERAAATAVFKHGSEMANLVARYGDSLISDETDRRLYMDFRALTHDWTLGATQIVSLSSSGHKAEARAALISGDTPRLGRRLGDVLVAWIAHNERL